MGALTHNGEVLQSLPANASQINFDKTGTNLNSTQTESAIKEVNTKVNTNTTDINQLKSGLTNLLKYKVFDGAATDTYNHLYSTDVPVSQYVCVGGCTPNNPNYCIQLSNIEVSTTGFIRYRLYDVAANQIVSDNAAYVVYLVFVDTSMLSELVITP